MRQFASRFETSHDRDQSWPAARTPLPVRPTIPTSIRELSSRPSPLSHVGSAVDETPLDLRDTAPLRAVSGSLALAVEPAVEPALRPSAARRSILIVEDDPRTADVLRSTLELEGAVGWEIEVAAEGLRALEVAALTPPDLVLLDVRLPGMDGAEVYRRLRATPRGRRTRVLFLSAGTSLDLYQRGIDDGVLLRKPFDMQDLVRLVHALLDA